jgi:hypothetical protein
VGKFIIIPTYVKIVNFFYLLEPHEGIRAGAGGVKNSVARKTSVPTTRGGLERKIGRTIIKTFFGK